MSQVIAQTTGTVEGAANVTVLEVVSGANVELAPEALTVAIISVLAPDTGAVYVRSTPA
ncbi:hypothetical protein D3C85_1728460 [compost metagenome]